MANANTRQARKTNPKPPTVDDAKAKALTAVDFENRPITFTPLAESAAITLTPGLIRDVIATRSRSGNLPQRADLITFAMLCKARGLNPYVKDAYLIGYDEKQGDKFVTKWTLIVAIQALQKRAEIHDQYDGTRQGIIVKDKETGAVEECEGALRLDNQILLGGWAEVYRKDRKVPTRARLKLSTYDTGKSRWGKDPEGMIAKCAEAAALRRAFPSDVGGLYLREEFSDDGRYVGDESKVVDAGAAKPRQLGDLTDQLRESAQSEIDAQDQMAVDQSVEDVEDVQAPPVDDGEPQMSAEEMADMERERAEHEGRRDHGGKQKTAFDTAPGYDQQG